LIVGIPVHSVARRYAEQLSAQKLQKSYVSRIAAQGQGKKSQGLVVRICGCGGEVSAEPRDCFALLCNPLAAALQSIYPRLGLQRISPSLQVIPNLTLPSFLVAARALGKSRLARLGLGVLVTAATIRAGFGASEDPRHPGSSIRLEIGEIGPFWDGDTWADPCNPEWTR
jgi:hypothetical protein